MQIVSDFMKADHDYLDNLLLLYKKKIDRAENFIKADEIFKAYKKRLLSHIELENNFLFPRFDEYLGLNSISSPTKIAVKDHEIIIEFIKIIEEADSQDLKKINEIAQRLRGLKNKHFIRENQIQYPVGDFFVKEDEWRKVLKDIYGQEEIESSALSL